MFEKKKKSLFYLLPYVKKKFYCAPIHFNHWVKKTTNPPPKKKLQKTVPHAVVSTNFATEWLCSHVISALVLRAQLTRKSLNIPAAFQPSSVMHEGRCKSWDLQAYADFGRDGAENCFVFWKMWQTEWHCMLKKKARFLIFVTARSHLWCIPHLSVNDLHI